MFFTKYLHTYILFVLCKTCWCESLILMIRRRTWKEEVVNLESLNFMLLNIFNSVVYICSICSVSSVYASLPNSLVTWSGIRFIERIP